MVERPFRTCGLVAAVQCLVRLAVEEPGDLLLRPLDRVDVEGVGELARRTETLPPSPSAPE